MIKKKFKKKLPNGIVFVKKKKRKIKSPQLKRIVLMKKKKQRKKNGSEVREKKCGC